MNFINVKNDIYTKLVNIILLLVVFNFPLSISISSALANQSLPLQHGKQQPLEQELSAYLVSEKLDGVRGYWDGNKLRFRSGKLINPPSWFTENFPPYPLDGELWIARGKFEQLSAIVRTKVPDDHLWQQVRFMVFDLPSHSQTFQRRHQIALQELTGLSLYLKVLPQHRFITSAELEGFYREIIDNKGEGVMLHLASSHYHAGRTSNIIKLKPYYDAEAEVLAHIEGKGKYRGVLGSLLVRTSKGVEFKVGSGFSLAERESPPKIGSIITYRYSGYTRNGIPRFATFVRQRELD